MLMTPLPLPLLAQWADIVGGDGILQSPQNLRAHVMRFSLRAISRPLSLACTKAWIEIQPGIVTGEQ